MLVVKSPLGTPQNQKSQPAAKWPPKSCQIALVEPVTTQALHGEIWAAGGRRKVSRQLANRARGATRSLSWGSMISPATCKSCERCHTKSRCRAPCSAHQLANRARGVTKSLGLVLENLSDRQGFQHKRSEDGPKFCNNNICNFSHI